MFYDSKTQIIQFTDWQSGRKSPLNNLQTRWKKRNEYRRVENELSIKSNIKASNINLAWISIHVRKKFLNLLTQLIQSTDQQTKLKKHQTVKKNFLYISVLNTFQYKRCLCMLTLSKCNEKFLELICLI